MLDGWEETSHPRGQGLVEDDGRQHPKRAPLLRCDATPPGPRQGCEQCQWDGSGQQEMFPGSLVNLMLCPDPGKHAQGFQTPS